MGRDSQQGRPSKASKQRHNRDYYQIVQDAAECLATHERRQGNRLHSSARCPICLP